MTAGTLSLSKRIAQLNDRARQAMGLACVVVVTEGFRSLSEADQMRVRDLVETFDAFTPVHVPDGERDCGAIYRDGDGRWTNRATPTTCQDSVLEDRCLRPRLAVQQ